MALSIIKSNPYGGYISRHDAELLDDKINRICNLLTKIRLAKDAARQNPDFETLRNLHVIELELSENYLELVQMVLDVIWTR